MKRQALGKGLNALIPGKSTSDILAPRSDAGRSGESESASMSAADIIGIANLTQPVPPIPRGPQEEPRTDDGLEAPGVSAGAAIKGAALHWIDTDRIRPNPHQPRKQFPQEQLEELAASIQESGILQPIIVRRVNGGYGLVAGERRWRAAQKAGLLKVPALVREVSEDKLLEIALVENLQRQDLNPMEEARAYQSLIDDFGLTPVEVADRVGRQRPTITNSTRLLALPAGVQEMVESGKLSMGHARALLGLGHQRARELAAEMVVKRRLSVRETETWVALHAGDGDTSGDERAVRKRDPNIGDAEQKLQRALGTRVRIVPGRGEKGRILIDYYSEAELQGLYQRLSKA